MCPTVLNTGWLSRNGAWARRTFLAFVLALLFVGKALGIPDNSLTAKACLFVALGFGALGLLLYAAEYPMAVRRRGYWFDHYFD